MKRQIQLTLLAASLLAAPAAFAAPGVRDHRAPRGHRFQPVVTGFSPQSARPGGEVVVFGERFPAGTKVLLGGKAIAYPRITADRISFTIPAGATDSAIVLRVPGLRGDLTVGQLDVVTPPPVWSRGDVPGTARGRPGYLDQYDRDLRATRDGRRARNVWSMRARFERRFLATAEVQAELRLHAKRTASLNRMLAIAQGQNQRRLVVRVNRALSRENTRHEAKIDALRATYYRNA